MKKIAIILAIIIVVLVGVLIFIPAKAPEVPPPGSMVSSDGHVTVTSPNANATVVSPVTITGSVTGGGWFFEASFPVQVLDADGTVLGGGIAKAQGEWMSTGTVPFVATIAFKQPHAATGTIVLSKDNPSGLPEHDLSLSIPVVFGKAPASAAAVTVSGKVQLGPTCPVERIPPDPACAPKPYQTSVMVSKNIETPENFKTIQTNAAGMFTVSLQAGEYILHPKGGAVYPRCDEKIIEVGADEISGIVINCDTGIR